MPRSISTPRHVTPDSNQMSTMLCSFANDVPPQCAHASPGGANASTGSVHQRSDALPSSKRARASPWRSCARAAGRARTRCTSYRRRPGSAFPTRAGATRTTPDGCRPSATCGSRPTPASTSRRARRARSARAAMAVHPDEPLRRGAEDHRVLAAPAVRVAMIVRLARTSAPDARRSSTIRAFASKICRPAYGPASAVKRPPESTGLMIGKP